MIRWCSPGPGSRAHAVPDGEQLALCGNWSRVWGPAIDATQCRICRERVDVDDRQLTLEMTAERGVTP
jgi:hypothetical protein